MYCPNTQDIKLGEYYWEMLAMTKTCAVCNRKLKLLDSNVVLQDGKICEDCCKKIGLTGFTVQDDWGKQHTVDDAISLMMNGTVLDLKQWKKDTKQKVKAAYEAFKQAYTDADTVKFERYYFDDADQKIFKDRTMFEPSYYEIPYTDVVGYRPVEEGHSKTKKKHGIVRTVTGGALLGPIGAIAGAVSSTGKQFDVVDNISVLISLKDNKTETVSILSSERDNGSFAVSSSRDELNRLSLKLDEIINANNHVEQNDTQKDIPTKSISDQLHELKSLVDEGILTQDEFEAKKKQILGI